MKNINLPLAQTQQEFNDFYKKNLRDIYAALEPVRYKNIKSLILRLFLFATFDVCLFRACCYGLISENVYTSDGFIRILGAVLFLQGYLIYSPFENYRTQTKNKVMKIILSFWGRFTYYHERDIIGEQIINKSEIFRYFNRTEIDDAFNGIYNDVSLDVSEHNLRIHGNKGDTHIFKGVLIMLDFPKKFKGKTVAKNKGRWVNLLFNNPLWMLPVLVIIAVSFMPVYFLCRDGWQNMELADSALIFMPAMIMGVIIGIVCLIYFHKHPRKASQKVELEGLKFMRRWSIFTSDQIEARYILTPLFMEKMQEIKRLFYGKHVDFSFFDNKLLIAVHTRKNMFETTSLFVSALSYQKVRQVISQLHSIFSVIDIINPPEK